VPEGAHGKGEEKGKIVEKRDARFLCCFFFSSPSKHLLDWPSVMQAKGEKRQVLLLLPRE
jgi:hypothetical protein